jgi:hypothetical protein
MTQIAATVLTLVSGPRDTVQLSQHLGGEIRGQSPLEHHAARDPPKLSLVSSAVGIHKGSALRTYGHTSEVKPQARKTNVK